MTVHRQPTSETVVPAPQTTDEVSSGPRPWHALPYHEVLRAFDVGPEGLSEGEARRRLARFGPNRLRTAPRLSAWRILAAQVRSLVVALLFAAALLAVLLGDLVEAGAIAAVLAINTGLGFWTELRARKAMDALRTLQVQAATVRRQGAAHAIDAATLVPGDLIVLEAGDAVPADARLISSTELSTVEAPLTGESLPVLKRVEPIMADDAEALPAADRLSMVFKGTLIAAGAAEAVITETGPRTEIGRISELLRETEDERTPLERRLDRLGRRLVGFVLALASVVVALGLWRGAELWRMVETGIALAVAAVPEGLPVVATITLAVGMRRMAVRHALLRHLPSVETLGSTTVVCTDKTGTLTAGEMTATRLYVAGRSIEVTGSGYGTEGELRIDGVAVEPSTTPGLELALRIAVLTNHARIEATGVVEGDPTEAALLVLGRKAGVERRTLLERYPVCGELPFSSERMLMATCHETQDGPYLYLKGAPHRLVELATEALEGEGAKGLDPAERERLLEINRRLAGQGLRVLALAARRLDPGEPVSESALRDLTLVGFVGLMDPPAPRVKETVDRLRHAGIRTVMITGDQAVTAEAIGRQLGVLTAGESTLDGRQLARLSEDELTAKVAEVGTFARTGPEDKLRIVRALQERGEIVGMLGDGVNDAPALKQADIGVAMGGRGTDVAKETAEMVLSDDRFESVAAAVEEGRVVFANIQKFVFYLFSCNLSEALVVVASVLAGLPLPLLPLQILWLNLITDVFPALALAVEPAEPGIMSRPPRDPRAPILSRGFVTQVSGYGVLITLATLSAFQWALASGEKDPRRAMTVAFMTLALAQLLHVFNARSPEAPAFAGGLGRNPWIWGALALTVLLQLLAIYLPPLSGVLRTVPLEPADWAVVGAASLLPLVAGQLLKVARRSQTAARKPVVG